MGKKKLVSMLVVCSLILSLFVGTSGVAFGEEKAAGQVVITALPTFEVGGSIADAKIEYEPTEGVHVRTVWQIYDTERDEDTRWFEVKDGIFEAGRVYELFIYATVDEGYVPYAEMFVYHGEDLETWFASDDETGEDIMFHSFGRYSDRTAIAKAEIHAAEPEVGKTATIDQVVFYDQEGNVVEDATLKNGVKWQCLSKGDAVNVTGETFEAEEVYFLIVDLPAGEKYTFIDPVTMVVNGNEEEVSTDPDSCVLYVTYSLETPLSVLEIFGLPEVKEGNEITADIQHELAYATVDAYWTNAEDEMIEAGENFEAGKTYILNLGVSTYYQPLAEDFAFKVYGKTYAPKAENLDTTYNNATVQIEFKIPEVTEEEPPVESEEPQQPETPEEDEKSPATGDSSSMMMWIILAAVGFTGVMGLGKREQ